ncbi:hypothetical protein BJV82DRAFT_614452 [Fennellomyces sp. T-0311]|nr:hypothetical protein BJV82DRAFT_614452 [Fennellomyces sp. T-0311]
MCLVMRCVPKLCHCAHMRFVDCLFSLLPHCQSAASLNLDCIHNGNDFIHRNTLTLSERYTCRST